jgi:hypothetical protein
LLRHAGEFRRGLAAERGGATSVQMLILTIALALAGVVAVRFVGSSIAARTDCAGQQIATLQLGAGPCGEAAPENVPVLPGEPITPAQDRERLLPLAVAASSGGDDPGAEVTIPGFDDSADEPGNGGGSGGGESGGFQFPGPLVDLTDILPPPQNCVPRGTRINTSNGLVPIESLTPDDEVDFSLEPNLALTLEGFAFPSELPAFGQTSAFDPAAVLRRELQTGNPGVVCEDGGPAIVPILPGLALAEEGEQAPAEGQGRTNDDCESDADCARGHCRSNGDGTQSCNGCTQQELADLRGLIHGPNSFCDSRPRGCRSLSLTEPPSAFETRAFNGSRCIAARSAVRDRCFGGGDPDDEGHIIAIALAATTRALCLCLADVARIPGLSSTARGNARGVCRRRFSRSE